MGILKQILLEDIDRKLKPDEDDTKKAYWNLLYWEAIEKDD